MLCYTINSNLDSGLLIGFGNQLRVLLEGVGAVDARSAALGPRFYDGLAETSDRNFLGSKIISH